MALTKGWCPGPYARWTKVINGPCRHYKPRKGSNTPSPPLTLPRGGERPAPRHKFKYPPEWLTKDGKLSKKISQKKIAEFRRLGKKPSGTTTRHKAKKSVTRHRAKTTGGIDFYTQQFLKGNSDVRALPYGLSKVSARDLYGIP